MAVVAFVPVRCGSKSIPMKNIKMFCGKPLVYWALKALDDSDKIDKIVLAIDCWQIEQALNEFKFSKLELYHRKKENATDTASTESVMLEFLEVAELKPDDVFILCQATSPFTRAADFDNALRQYEQENADSLLTCCRIKRFVWKESGEPLNYDYEKRPRRQDFDGLLVENGSFYINKVENILEKKNRLSGKIAVYEMPEYTFTEIDESEDWMVAEAIMRKYLLKPRGLDNIKIVLSDIDGVLTDASMYYSENGDELKKFNTYDGMAFKLFKKQGIKTGLITTEDRKLNQWRAEKLKMDYLFQGVSDKLAVARQICEKEGVTLEQVAYIGDDINDKELLEHVGLPVCPGSAQRAIKEIPNILILDKKGGDGVVRAFYDYITVSLS